ELDADRIGMIAGIGAAWQRQRVRRKLTRAQQQRTGDECDAHARAPRDKRAHDHGLTASISATGEFVLSGLRRSAVAAMCVPCDAESSSDDGPSPDAPLSEAAGARGRSGMPSWIASPKTLVRSETPRLSRSFDSVEHISSLPPASPS